MTYHFAWNKSTALTNVIALVIREKAECCHIVSSAPPNVSYISPHLLSIRSFTQPNAEKMPTRAVQTYSPSFKLCLDGFTFWLLSWQISTHFGSKHTNKRLPTSRISRHTDKLAIGNSTFQLPVSAFKIKVFLIARHRYLNVRTLELCRHKMAGPRRIISAVYSKWRGAAEVGILRVVIAEHLLCAYAVYLRKRPYTNTTFKLWFWWIY